MADEQNYALADGSVGSFSSWAAPSQSKQKETLERAFKGFAQKPFKWITDSDKIKKVILSDTDGSDFTLKFAMRSVSGGGRPGARPNELRVQTDPETINNLFAINAQGGTGLIIGVYCIEGSSALVLWRPLDGSTGSGSSSKQVDAYVVARAMSDGISSYVYPDGEVVYAIMPELFRSYINCLMPNAKQKPSPEYIESQEISMPHNMIYFGAPGTGKSYQLNEEALGGDEIPAKFAASNVNRITFHPDYT